MLDGIDAPVPAKGSPVPAVLLNDSSCCKFDIAIKAGYFGISGIITYSEFIILYLSL